MIAQSTSASSPSSSTLALKRFLYSHRYHCSSFREKFLRNSIMLALAFEADPHEIRQMKPFDSIMEGFPWAYVNELFDLLTW